MTFFDPTPQFSKAAVDAALEDAQTQSRLLLELERALNTSRDFLAKVCSPSASPTPLPLFGEHLLTSFLY